MQRFYDDFNVLNQFSLSLDYHQSKLQCAFCFKNDQFVSHGIIYKQRSMRFSEKVGKRLFCSNRYGRSGCGHTVQLYVCSEFPRFRYGAVHLFVFITGLLAQVSVTQAYKNATGQRLIEARQAWRWLHKLMFKLSDYRTFLNSRSSQHLTSSRDRSLRLQLLLPTLARLAERSFGCLCSAFQAQSQQSFL
jgi:hypothetical protein